MAIDVFTVNGVSGADNTINSSDLTSSNVVVNVSRSTGTTNGGQALLLVKDGSGNLIYWQIITLTAAASSQQATVPVGSLTQGALQFLVFQGTGTAGTSGTTTYPTATQFDWHGGASAGNVAVTSSTSSDFTAISATLDSVAPTVSTEAITSATGIQNSTLNAGDVVSVTVTMSEAVTVTGTPQLQLNIGGTLVQANYASGSGTSALVFTYTVLAGQTDANGISINANALSLNGGTITDPAGNAATLTAALVADNVNFKVDTTAPTVSTEAITSATGIQNSTLNAGDVVSVTVTMSEAVTVTGTPQLQLNIGGTLVQANYASGSGTSALVFTYTVLAGQTDANGISINANALSLNGGTITDPAGNAATLTAALVADNVNFKVDTTAPTVSTEAITSATGIQNSTLNAGDVVSVTVTMSEAVTVTGTPQLQLNIGGTLVQANYASGSGTSALVFTYTVLAGQTDANGISINANALSLNGGTITDPAGNAATLTAALVADNVNFKVDTTAPTVSTEAITSATGIQNSTLNAGDVVSVTVTMSEAVTVTGTPQLQLNIGGTLVQANYASGSGTSALVFTYTVLAGQTDANGISINANALSLNGGTITDPAGNAATLTAALVADNVNFKVDTTAPTVSTEAITSATGIQNSTLNAGDVVSVTVTMSEAVTVTGTPQLQLNIGGTLVQANYASGSGTSALVFTYTVLAGQTDANGISINANALSLNGGTITDPAGNAATLTAALVADNVNFKVDTTAPTVSTEAITSATGIQNSTLNAGDVVSVTVTMSEAVTVTGTPQLQLNIGGTLVQANYASGSGTSALVFTYTVLAGQTDANGISINANALSLNGGTITDPAGNAATLTAALVADNVNFKVDTTAPTVSTEAITSATGIQNSTLNAGDVVSVTVTMSEAVTVTGTPQLQLNIGGTLVQANYASGSGTSALVFTYTVLAGQTDANGISINANALSLNGGTITDPAGNAATLTAALVADNVNFKVDTTAPAAPVISSVTDDVAPVTGTVADSGFSNDTTLTIAGTAEAGSTVTLYDTDGTTVLGSGVATGGNFSITTSALSQATHNITATATDAAGNQGVASTAYHVTIDTTAPTVSSVTLDDSSLKIGDTSTVTITFSEAVSNFSNADVTVENGNLSALSSSDGGITWTGTFTPTANIEDATNVITVNAGNYNDAAGNIGGSGSSTNYAIDTLAPVFVSGTTADAIDENTGTGQVIYDADATDGAGVTYSLGGADAVAFTIDSGTGEVTLTGNPDFETKSSYSFDVTATDAAGNSTTQTVTLGINDVNEAPTAVVLSNEVASTAENGAAVKVADIAVTDDALGTNVLSLSGSDAGSFSIVDGLGGKELWFNGGADFEVKTSYDVTVNVNDAGVGDLPDASQSFTLNITNLDEVAPSITSGGTADAIDEKTGTGQVVYTATATDPATDGGPSDPVTYSLGGADAVAFTIDSGTGEVTLTGNPDFETKSSYSFDVTATDAAGNSTTQTVTLGINDVNEAPTAVVLSNEVASTAENGAAVKVADIAVTDDALGTNVLSLSGSDAGSFSIVDGLGGKELWFNGGADFEVKTSYDVTVNVNDAGVGDLPDASQSFTLNITNLDEVAPSITSGGTADAIDEKTGTGQVVYTATATDPATDGGPSDPVTYSLGGADAVAFTIDSGTGEVTLTGNPDFETKSSYSFDVTATDAAGNSTTQTVTLGINNLDEVAPSITSGGTAAAIDENSGAGQVVYTATATDSADISAGVTFSLGGADASFFTIDSGTGEVTLTGNPDFETKSSYSFSVLADDGVNTPTQQAVTLGINNLDEVAPSITSGGTAAAIDENSGAGQVVYTATATDSADISAGVTFSLGGADASFFTIDSGTGEVTLTGNPDFETKSSYSFSVLADDGVNTPTQQAVTLGINNLDEVAPSITSGGTAAAIDENSGAGQVVYTATATDSADISAGVTFSLGGADASFFTIDSGTGEVTLTGNPDFETKSSYSFSVLADDGVNTPTQQAVTLGINNLDEVAPSITSGGTAAAIDENSGAGQVVYTATATDSADISAGVTFSLGGADASFFTIDSGTGEVTLTGNPDFETKSSYSFSVLADDGVNTPTQQAVQIAVTNVDGVTIKGLAKNDTINGTKTVTGQHVFASGEEDTISGGRGNDTISSLGGNDTVSGGGGNDKLAGGDGNDLLKGGSGNDTLTGGLGTDTMFGNSGADKFIFALGDSVTAAPDTIADFKHSQLDKIDLHLIDANAGLSGDQKFHFIGSADFTGNHAAGAAGELRFDTASHLVEGDTDGDGNADFAIHVNVNHLVKGDFIL